MYQSLNITAPTERSLKLAYITIELDNLNIGALREFTISTIRKAKTLGGGKVSVNLNLGTEEEIAAYILSIINSVKFKKLKSPTQIDRAKEQAIRDPKQIEQILIACSATNLPSLQTALSLNSNMFRDLKYLRHFYAHRNKDTLSKAFANSVKVGTFSSRHPDEMLLHVAPGKTHAVIEEWLTDAKLFYELLMQ
ncbi:MAG: hypothetical protein WDN30_07910 [Pararobbsia sp.]